MNILYITNHLNIGGITSYVLTLACGLKKKGHQVYVASSAGELIPEFMNAGIQYVHIPIRTKKEISPGVIFSFFKLSAFIKKNNIQLVHSQSRTTQVLGCLLAKASGVSHVSTCHGFFRVRPLRKIIPCWGTKTIAISQAVKEHLVKDFGLAQERIRMIHSGIDADKFQGPRAMPAGEAGNNPELKKKGLGLSSGPVVGVIARLSSEKGHSYLIQALKIVLQKIPQAQLLIVGDGKMREGLVKLTQDLGLERNVFFISANRQTKELFLVMDVFVMPSLKEGLGLALMEAMAYGLAVVGTDVGGIKTLIRDQENGILVKPAESESLALAISELLDDSTKREKLGNNARTFILQEFSAEKMVLETERMYQECLDLKN
jgi:glycosyltransferase involved in cell wall biosynthesis